MSIPADEAAKQKRGPRFDQQELDSLTEMGRSEVRPPTWRGWVLALLSIILLCKLVPLTDYVLGGTRLTLNVLPFSSIFLTYALILGYNAALVISRGPLNLSKQDLALVFCMTMVANHIPGHGFLSFLTAEMTAPTYYATTENGWAESIQPYIPEALIPHDPPHADAPGPRPVKWFFMGLPDGERIPWGAWAGPFGIWAIAMLCLHGMMFAVCALFEKHWSESEMLPFPLAQVPGEMLSGLGNTQTQIRDGGVRSFLHDRLTWWGIGLTFALQSWNVLQNYILKWPMIHLRNTSFGWEYLTEPPFRQLNPVWFVIYPSIIGLTYLISLEISFSLWFFYIVVLKLAVITAIYFGLGARHDNFMYNPQGDFGMFINLGTGALLGLVLVSVYRARDVLKESLKQALGLSPVHAHTQQEGMSPRTLWLLLTISFFGSVAWLMVFNVRFQYALTGTLSCLMLTIGVARMISLGGIFYVQVQTSPIELTLLAAPPAVMGAQSFVPLSMWSRLAVFDYYRLAPTIPLITSMHVGRITGLKRSSLFWGIGIATLFAMLLGFFGFYSTLYHNDEAAHQSWVFTSFAQNEFKRIGSDVVAVKNLEAKTEALGQTGTALPETEVPAVARRNYASIQWLLIGMILLFVFVALRSRLFWWPNPIGFIVWSGQRAIALMWFSFFLGWLIKWAIIRFGGQRVYLRLRRFFVGLIVGEAIAAIVWIAVAMATDTRGGYTMHFN